MESAHMTCAERLDALRSQLKSRQLDGFIIPRSDEHQGEEVPAHSDRLKWLTGFSGTAGVAVVMLDNAAIFVDGRYTLQVRDEVSGTLFGYHHLITEPPTAWIRQTVTTGAKIGYDPWLMTPNQVKRYQTAAQTAGASLVAQETNPLDAVWPDQPPPPKAPVVGHGIQFTGRESSDKRAEIAASLVEQGLDAAVLAAPDSIAWLLNVRGGDLPSTPQPLSFAVVHNDARVDWYIDPDKLREELGQFPGSRINYHPPAAFGPALEQLGKTGASVGLNGDSEPHWVYERLLESGASVHLGHDPCTLPKAIKTPVELDGARRAHRRDGLAVIRFLHWLDEAVTGGDVSEIDASDQLEHFRRKGEHFRGLSFPTISGFGPNGAIVHYRATKQSSRILENGSLYLVDSGGQYLDGTTDITRTISVGTPAPEMQENFTRVLQGHIAVAAARFPAGTTGSQIDPFARKPLWDAGLDYDHGTGHGVGSYLNVHEGPHRMSKAPSTVALVPGMIVSNEPGYYKSGAYGIRIENLVAVTKLESPPGAERELLSFETLSEAPVDLRLVAAGLMSEAEIAWLNAYHARVRDSLMPLIEETEKNLKNWLQQATRPIGQREMRPR